ncbi:unnamed protein product [Arabidopsis arenosa]|uniref:Legume lectin domain-containing protein n=1 Tax=Arabidopsis arenosa TaxID=38785 RepID=A0A8S2A7F2_ARAAE|nr:unnamed protein product [Arabidopsis arenosa]
MNERTNGTRESRIVAVEFDTRKSHPDDLDGNHVGLNVNNINSVVQESLSSRGITINSSIDFTAHVRYDGKNLSVYVSRNPEVHDQRNLVFSWPIDLSAYLPENVYIGFTASTSDFTQLNCVKSWSFEGSFLGGQYLRSRSKAGETNPDIEAELDNCATNPQKFKLRELKKATGNFTVENKLGQGGFGMVFKGKWEGLACCHPNPNLRPSMKTVLKVLTGETSPPDVPTERPAFVWPVMPPSFGVVDYSLTGSQDITLTELTGR